MCSSMVMDKDYDPSKQPKLKIEIKITERGNPEISDDDLYMMKTIKETQPNSPNPQIMYCLTDRKKKKISFTEQVKQQLLKKSPFSKTRSLPKDQNFPLKNSKSKISENSKKSEKVENDDEEGLCFICFCNESNVVFLDCGHGGVCLDCAMDTIKRNNICALCRENVNQIIEIDPKIEIRNGLYKVLNSFYVSKEDPKDNSHKEPGNVDNVEPATG